MTSPGGRALGRGLWRAVAALVLLAAVLWWADPAQVLALAADASPGWLAAGLASAVAANVASALRWRALAGWLGHRPPAAWALDVYFRAVALNALLPGAVVGGDMYRAHAVSRRGLPLMEAGLSVLFDRLSGLWMLVVAGAAAGWYGLVLGAAPAAGGGAGPGAAWAASLPGPAGLAAAIGALLGVPIAVLLAWRRRAPQPGAAAVDHQRLDAPWRQRLAVIAQRPGIGTQYAVQAVASTLVQLLSIGTLWCAAMAMGVNLPWWALAVAAVPTFLMATLPVSFGGWGTREAAAVLSLGLFGVSAPQAVGVSMLYGLAALAQAVAGVVLLVRSRQGTGPAPRRAS